MGKLSDLTGQTFGRWKVLRYAGNRKWLCECQCENKTQKEISTYSLRKRLSNSCGCLRKELNSISKVVDLTGMKFGEWTVLEYIGNSYWKCKCSCGTIRNVKAQSLLNEASKSCGHNTTGFKDLTGQTFGDWEVLRYCGNQYYECKCSVCNTISLVSGSNLVNGLSKSCGKHKTSNKLIDITGQEFGELKVINYIGGNKWLCRCSCGNITIKYSHNLRRSSSISCGCKDEKPYTKDEILNLIKQFIAEHNDKPYRDELQSLLNRGQSTVERYIHKYNLEEYLNKHFRSRQEREIHSLFNTDNINVRNIIDGELDLYYPSNNFAIEFNGSYWHSDLYKNKNYHKQKTIECAKKGIQLFHIFEYEWDDKDTKNKLINIIKNKLDTNSEIRTIYGRNTVIKNISSDVADDFINKYHIQNSSKASINLGLFLDTELLGVMTFGKPRFNRNYQYELIRLCWNTDVRVIGGTQKLFNYFVKKYNPSSIISYCDISKFTGNIYIKLGFSIKEITEPNYIWWKPCDNIIMRRYETMKHKLISKGLGNESQTEDEIMRELGFLKIYDSGNMVFTWNKEQRDNK